MAVNYRVKTKISYFEIRAISSDSRHRRTYPISVMLSPTSISTGPSARQSSLWLVAFLLTWPPYPGGRGLPYETDGDARRLA